MDAKASRNRDFVIESSGRVDSPAPIMERLRRPSTWPEWQSEILATEGPQELRVGDQVTGSARMLGFAVAGRAQILTLDDARMEEDVIVGVRMKIGYSLAPDGDSWRLTHRLVADLPRGLSGRVLSFFLTRRLKRMQRELLDALGATRPSATPSSTQREAGT